MKNAPPRVATMNCRGFALEVPAASVPMVAVAQLVRVLDCDSRCRGFESPQPPQFRSATAGCRDDCTPTAQAAGGKKPLSRGARRSEEHTSELQSLMRISYAVFCLKKKKKTKK